MQVLYTSPTCGPCRTLKPMINAVVDEFEGRVHFVEINIEQDPEIAEAAGAFPGRSTPSGLLPFSCGALCAQQCCTRYVTCVSCVRGSRLLAVPEMASQVVTSGVK